jgi:putative pyruvate formate lyase activating enzyme
LFTPSYIETYRTGKLAERIKELFHILENCHLCPRQCEVNRLEDERGTCKTGRLAMVSSFNPHFGEEDPLVGKHGSGTIFMTNCNLLCVFCQNWDISHQEEGSAVTSKTLAGMMLHLQGMGCHNINFVTPTHVTPQILHALPYAIDAGLNVPLVYNSGGYDAVETLKLLDGIFDIYMPDFKFWDSVMRFVANEISADTYVNVMNQYRPCGLAYKEPSLNRSITQAEYETALEEAREEGITRLDMREKKGIIFRRLDE